MPSVSYVNNSPAKKNTSAPARGSPLNPASSRERLVSSNPPSDTNAPTVRIAPLRIHFVIVGGGESYVFKPIRTLSRHPFSLTPGISGLACAYALGRSGHSVCVLEQA